MPTLGVRIFLHIERPWKTLQEAEEYRKSVSATLSQHILDTFNDDGSIKQVWIEGPGLTDPNEAVCVYREVSNDGG